MGTQWRIRPRRCAHRRAGRRCHRHRRRDARGQRTGRSAVRRQHLENARRRGQPGRSRRCDSSDRGDENGMPGNQPDRRDRATGLRQRAAADQPRRRHARDRAGVMRDLLDAEAIVAALADGLTTAVAVAKAALSRIRAYELIQPQVWIARSPDEEVLAAAARVDARIAAGESLPLAGVPFAIKDNIDLVGLATTAACPDFAYLPAASAGVVERLVAAGAIPMGKTNLDQFATGLSGTRSPYGAPACVFNRRYISGGSSSGSSVAVAAGLVSFALGTDTAGSGRIPAAFNNVIGLKPTRGLISTRGSLPACRSLDCLSIF